MTIHDRREEVGRKKEGEIASEVEEEAGDLRLMGGGRMLQKKKKNTNC